MTQHQQPSYDSPKSNVTALVTSSSPSSSSFPPFSGPRRAGRASVRGCAEGRGLPVAQVPGEVPRVFSSPESTLCDFDPHLLGVCFHPTPYLGFKWVAGTFVIRPNMT